MKINSLSRAFFALTLLLTLGILGCKDATQSTPPRVIRQYTIEQFYKNTNVGGGFWSQDESKLLVHSNETGIYNLYEINVADGKMTALTHDTVQSLYAQGYIHPAGPEANLYNQGIIYSADQGGNELSHIYFLHDGISTDLTPETMRAMIS
ncbi:MAG: hypothetical protein IPP17_24115 [Bacteroidetes bacterium]|nr:hypothetical protein [Bacteroidota bacterium]